MVALPFDLNKMDVIQCDLIAQETISHFSNILKFDLRSDNVIRIKSIPPKGHLTRSYHVKERVRVQDVSIHSHSCHPKIDSI